MKILVTGSNGFIGSHLCRELLSRNIDFRATSRASSSMHTTDFVSCDLESESDLQFLIKDCDVIIHLAGRAHVTSDDSPEKYKMANEFVTERLAKAAAVSGVRRFIYLSSIKVNGESNAINSRFGALDTPNPQDNYGKSKLAAENRLKEICEESGMEFVIIRPTLVYGKGVKANFNALIKAVNLGLPLPISSIKNLRSMVGVNNLVDLIILSTDSEKASNQIFLVSDDSDISTPDLVHLIADSLNKKSRIFRFPLMFLKLLTIIFGKHDAYKKFTGSLTVDINHTKESLDWKPPRSMQQEIQSTVHK